MIKLIKSYNYNNNYDYIKTFSNKTSQNNYFDTYECLNVSDDNYKKLSISQFKVPFNYDFLVSEGVNYLIFNNGYEDIYAFITHKEYVSNNVTNIHFEVDVIQTYMFKFSLDKSFINRKKCLLTEITDFDEGLDIGEHTIVENNIAMFKEIEYFYVLSGNRTTELIKDKTTGDVTGSVDVNISLDKPTTVIDGITYPIALIPYDMLATIIREKLNDHPSLVGIIGLPNVEYTTKEDVKTPIMEYDENEEMKRTWMYLPYVSTITPVNKTGIDVGVTKNEVTDFFPYTYYVLTDGECEPLIMKPQYIDGSITIKERVALSYTPVSRYYPYGYKGDNTGTTYNITNSQQMSLPVATNEGLTQLMNSASAYEMQKKVTWNNTIKSIATGVGVGAVAGAGFLGIGAIPGAIIGGVGGFVKSGFSGFNSIKQLNARREDLAMTPNSIKSMGSPSTRSAFSTSNVRVQKYTITDKHKQKIKDFNERYGNKFNAYDTINLNSYKGFIKFVEPKIVSGIDNIFIEKIYRILERGVYIE